MPFDWEGFLTVAEGLANIPSEGTRRSAISRAYYAAFHLAEREYARHNPASVLTGDGYSHFNVWNWFKYHHGRAHRKIGIAGFDLKAQRIAADYRDDVPGLAEQTAFGLERARTIVSDLKRISAGE